ncbi:MAG: PCRF domain-containing protein, partial [Coriobacteriales bacterium]|nr:PCRF domain-containing protein [Coriobacteriales bacterium]
MEDLSTQIEQSSTRLGEARQYLQIDAKRAELTQLEQRFAQPGFWDDQQQATRISKRASDIRADLEAYETAWALLEDAKAADELAHLEDDESLFEEALVALANLSQKVDALELASWFTGELDGGDAIISVNPGQGGLEAQDWADMLFRMYLRYAQRHNWKVEVLDAPAGEVIGIDHATFIVSGHNAYGM